MRIDYLSGVCNFDEEAQRKNIWRSQLIWAPHLAESVPNLECPGKKGISSALQSNFSGRLIANECMCLRNRIFCQEPITTSAGFIVRLGEPTLRIHSSAEASAVYDFRGLCRGLRAVYKSHRYTTFARSTCMCFEQTLPSMLIESASAKQV